MQGSKIAITLPTGQVVEYELMRIGTVAEYRELVQVNDEIAGARDSALASVGEITRQRGELRAQLATLTERTQKTEETRAKKSERASALAEKLEADKTALEKLLAEILGAVDQLNED